MPLLAHPCRVLVFSKEEGIAGFVGAREYPGGGVQWRDQSSAHRFLHERADPCLFGGSQPLQREGGRPHGAFVEVRRIGEAERRVSRVELLRALEEADDLPVLGIRGHPIPGFR